MERAALLHPSYETEAAGCVVFKCFRLYLIKGLSRDRINVDDVGLLCLKR